MKTEPRDTVTVALLRRAVSPLAADVQGGKDLDQSVKVFHRRAQRALSAGKATRALPESPITKLRGAKRL